MAKRNEQNLPASIDAERFVLGSVLLDGSLYAQTASILDANDFSLEKHRRIFKRMGEVHDDGGHIDRITIANRLMMRGELESCDGLAYLVSLDDGLPSSPHVESYARIVKEKSTLRGVIFASQHMINRAMLAEETAQDILEAADKTIQSLSALLLHKNTLLSPQDIFDEHGGVTSFMANSVKPGISTGFPQIDEYTMGLQEGCTYIIGGRTGSGKTSLAENIGINVAKAGFPVQMFSLEMSKELVLGRALCAEAKVPFKAYIKNDLLPDQIHAIAEAVDTLAGIPFYVDDSPDLTVSEMPSRLDRAVAEKNIRLFIVDYLQIANAEPELKLISEYDRVTYASKVCRMMARKHKISGIALSQLSRPADKRKPGARPTLSDLKSSGGIENDAAAAILIHRPEMFEPGNSSLRYKAEAIIAKSRVGGQGTVHLEFTGKYYRFEDKGPQEHIDYDDED